MQLPHKGGRGNLPTLVSLWKKDAPREINSLLAASPVSRKHRPALRPQPEKAGIKIEEMHLLQVGCWTACTDTARAREHRWDSSCPYFIGFLGRLNGATPVEHKTCCILHVCPSASPCLQSFICLLSWISVGHFFMT